VTTNDPKTPNFNLVLRARFKIEGQPAPPPPPKPLNPNAVMVVEPSDRWITSALSGSSSTNTMYLYNPTGKPIHLKNAVPGGTEFTAVLSTIEDGKRYQLNVASNPSLKPGHYLQKVKIATDNTTQPEVEIEMDVTVYPRVFVSPASIIMPTLAIASDISAINWPVIYVRKVKETGLKIKSFSSTLPFLKLDLITDTDGQVYRIHFTLDKDKIKLGDFKGTIHIETNDADLPSIDVPVQGSFK